jgi:hypothetical protein
MFCFCTVTISLCEFFYCSILFVVVKVRVIKYREIVLRVFLNLRVNFVDARTSILVFKFQGK